MATQGRYRPDWTIGTLTLVQGEKDFTTTGSALEVAAIQPGDSIITASGLTLIIESITGQNSGTLMQPCSMLAAGANQPLRIRYQPEGSRLAGMAAMLYQMYGKGALYSLGELEGDEGQYLRFLAPGVLEAVAGGNLDVIRQLEKIANLEQLAALELQTNKVLRTNASKEIVQTDITSTGVALLKAPTIVGDQILYATGPDTFATSPLPPWSRTFLASPDAQEQRRIISASRPAFKAHLAANQLVYNGTTNLSFTASPLNVGNRWSGGVFTAPEAGMYFFSMGTTMGDGYGGQFIVQIFVNGSVYSEMVYPMNPQSGQQYYRAGTLSAAVQLAAGGTVQFKLVLDAVQGNPMMQAFRNFATGFLI